MLSYAKWTKHHDFHEGCINDQDHGLPMSKGCLEELLRPRASVVKRHIETAHGALFADYGTRFAELRTAASELLRPWLSFMASQLEVTYDVLFGEHGICFAKPRLVGLELLRDGLSFVEMHTEAAQVVLSEVLAYAAIALIASFGLASIIGMNYFCNRVKENGSRRENGQSNVNPALKDSWLQWP
jgi:hypothetical protein